MPTMSTVDTRPGVTQWKPYKENDMPALVPADRGRVSKTQNRADSEMDPDLWLWESIFFQKSEIG